MNLEDKALHELFQLADRVGKKRYHRLTQQDWEDYQKFNNWRYVNGNSESGTTQVSQDWVRSHSGQYCPICEDRFTRENGRTIDHKLPRSQYPWLSLDFSNLWVVCHPCNQEKGEKHWYEYEHYVFVHYPERYDRVRAARPTHLLRSR